MKSTNLRQRIVFVLMLGSSTLAYASQMPASKENVLVLNRGAHKQVLASSLNEANGDKLFKSSIHAPGVTITEQVRQQAGGEQIEENRIVVSMSDHESVELVQQFGADGKKVSQSTIKQPLSSRDAFANSEPVQGIVETKGDKNNLAIHQSSKMEGHQQLTTTVIQSDNLLFNPGIKRWMLWVSAGYGHYDDAIKNDGSTGIARLALNYSILQRKGFNVGIEAGIENGTDFRPNVNPAVSDALGGATINATIKPYFELLPTISKQIPCYERYGVFAKFGAAFRTMTFDRISIPNLNATSADLHLGVTAKMSDCIDMLLDYQHIFGGPLNIDSTMNPLPANNEGRAYSIPSEQAIMLGIIYSF